MTQLPDHNQPRFGDFGAQPPAEPVTPTRLSILAVLSLITGILALPICCIPAGGTLFGLLPIGLGLGSLRAIRKSRGETAGKSLAIGGLVLGLLAAIVSTLVWAAIGSMFAKMPAVYAQVLDEDPAVVRTVLTTSVANSITDEEIVRFREGFLAEYGDSWSTTAGIAPLLKGYLAAGDPQGLQTVQVGPSQSPVPLPIVVDGGWTYLIVIMQQGENLGAGLPALANAAYQTPDGSLVWMLDTQPEILLPDNNTFPDNQSPQPDPADELPGTPASDPPVTDPDA